MNIINSIKEELNGFAPISLDEMKAVRLMDRIDTKYVVATPFLIEFIRQLKDNFLVQEIDGKQIAQYKTLYFDTPFLDMFRRHQCGKLTRQKIRIRNYIDTDNAFLEIKNKNNKGRTKKSRISCEVNSWSILSEYTDFLEKKARYPINELQPHLFNQFSRITLINNDRTERLTIDLGLSFYNQRSRQTADLSPLAIIELKQQGNCESFAKEILTEKRIRATGFSKYCIGCALTMPNLPIHNLKKKIRHINKLANTIFYDTI